MIYQVEIPASDVAKFRSAMLEMYPRGNAADGTPFAGSDDEWIVEIIKHQLRAIFYEGEKRVTDRNRGNRPDPKDVIP